MPFDQAVLFDADVSYASYMNGIDDPWTNKLLPRMFSQGSSVGGPMLRSL